MPKLIVLKLGGSVITKKSENKSEVNRENLDRLAKEISEARKEKKFGLMVVHGAGPFGHVLAKKYELDKGLRNEKQLEGFAKTHQSMERLNEQVVGTLQKHGINAIAYQPSSLGLLKNKKIIQFPTGVIKGFLDLGMVPVSYGDVLVDLETGINILSGDHLVPYLAKELEADRVIIATDVDGIYNGDPKTNKNAKPVKEINSKNFKKIRIGGSKAVDVTGGMKRKVQELLEIAKLGIESQIIGAAKKGNLKMALLGNKKIGTIIKN